jgi:SNF2 family DNA or RNA helicase
MLLVPGAAYQKDGTWHVPPSWATCLVLRGVFGAELKLGGRLVQWASSERRRVERAMELRDALDINPASSGAQVIAAVEHGSELKLRSFQRADVAYLVTMQRAGLLMPMGAGKTAVAIRTLQVMQQLGMDPYPALVVSPKSVMATTWPRELERWAPELDYSIVLGTPAKRRKAIIRRADVTVVNWDLLKAHSRVAGYGSIRLTDKDRQEKELNELAPRTVIFDEAARLRDAESAQSRAAKWLAHRAQYAFALTGTPISNDDAALELWGLLHVIQPAWHPLKGKYSDRYVEIGYSLYGGIVVLGLNPASEPEFRQVTQPLFRRLPKEVVLPDLPPKLPVIYRHTPMTPRQAKAYHEMEEHMLAQLNELLEAGSPLAAMTRLLQFASASARIEERTDAKGVVHRDVRLEEPSAKVDDLLELLEEMDDEPLVVGAESPQLIQIAAERLAKHGISHGMIAGGVPMEDRAEAVRRFQAGALRVMLVVLASGAEGITLTRARVLLFMEESWRTDRNAQFEDRVHRIGSEIHQNIQVIKQVTPGTIEERKPLVLAGKLERVEQALGDKDTLKRLLGGA